MPVRGEAAFANVPVQDSLYGAVAAAAALSTQGSITPTVAGIGSVIASFTSIAFTMMFITRANNRVLVNRMIWSMGWVALAGVTGILISHLAEPWVMQWLPRLTGLQGSVQGLTP